VPHAVLYDSQTAYDVRDDRVMTLANAEAEHLAKSGWHLPMYTMVTVSPWGWNGITVTSTEPTRYTVALVRYAYVDEEQVSFTMSHEAGHILMAEANVPQSEDTADAFAWCFGSAKAKAYAERNNRGVVSDCDALSTRLSGKVHSDK
jgi:hypothetical protein